MSDNSIDLIDDYRNNVLIANLPPLYDRKEALKLMRRAPKFDAADLKLSATLRAHLVPRIDDLIVPLSIYGDVEQRIAMLLRRGYVGRNPENPGTWRRLYQLAGDKKAYTMPPEISDDETAGVILIVGLSGVGKTTMVKRVLHLYPQVIEGVRCSHATMKQVVWLRVEAPSRASARTFCLEFFAQMDRLTGSDYYIRHVKAKTSADGMLPDVAKLAATHFVGLIVIDELQKMLLNPIEPPEKLLDFFLSLVNNVNVPIVLLGTPSAVKLFKSQMRYARRVESFGAFDFKRLGPGKTWDLILEKAWKYQWVSNPGPLTDNLKDFLYHHTQGLPALLLKWLKETQIEAINSGIETLNEEVLARVFEQVRLTDKAVEALRAVEREKKEGSNTVLLPGSFDDIRSPMEYIEGNDGEDGASLLRKALAQAKEQAAATERALAAARAEGGRGAPEDGAPAEDDEESARRANAKGSEPRGALPQLGPEDPIVSPSASAEGAGEGN